MSDKLSEYYCEYCLEQYVEEFDGEYTLIQIDLRPYDLFCFPVTIQSTIYCRRIKLFPFSISCICASTQPVQQNKS